MPLLCIGRNAQQAVDIVAERLRAGVRTFDAAAERLLSRTASDDSGGSADRRTLRAYLDGCRYFVTGNLEWR